MENAQQSGAPDLSLSSIGQYLWTRIPTLKPPPFSEKKHLLNPFPALREITLKQWMFILVAFLGWSWDAFDFFSVSLVASEMAVSFNKELSDITWGITLVLMLRSVGAVIFGLAGDKWGRKWPFIINCVLFIVLELGTGFVQTYQQFLGVRALFGIAMGGIYGNCAATALDDCPVHARGFISGLLQQGYAFGYLLCVIFNRAIVPNSPHGWRALFWFGAGPPVFIIVFRMLLPETDGYLAQKHLERDSLGKSFVDQGKVAIKQYWLKFIYLILFCAGMNFMSHGSQDLFPTYLKNQLNFSENAATVSNCVANLGALTGGIVLGHLSEFVGRRLTIMIACVIGGAIIYPWGFVHGNASINASAFFMQVMVQGAWGVVPIHVSELSPPQFRSFIVGVSYQLGNLVSSASSTIESTIGERFPLHDANGNIIPGRFEYGRVMAILMGAVFAYQFLICLIGPENRSANLLSTEVDESTVRAIRVEDEEKRMEIEHKE
ncbi:carboxylic acid transporter protein homolog [Trichomonascus vanleenenianus]|uniref:monocarboxylate/H+ symporter n=1 Tax=Trichomonascus vanleenenianus TaxID=2268995 RepID=UPI003ECAB2E0